MKLLVTELTRMRFRDGEQTICVAGADVETGKRIRPVLSYPSAMPLAMAAEYGGLFDVGRIIDLGEVRSQPRKPEIEDVVINQGSLLHLGTKTADEFFASLPALCVERPSDAIGDALVRHPNGRGLVTTEGEGNGSLAIEQVPPAAMELIVERGGVRSLWNDGTDLSVTDLGLYHDGARAHLDRVARLNWYLQQSECFVAFGLTRPFSPDGTGERYHWLQVNAIHTRMSYAWRA